MNFVTVRCILKAEEAGVKTIYAVLCLLGLLVPYYFFISFLLSYGFDLGQLFSQMLASPIAMFFVADIVISSVVLWMFIYQETRKRPIKLWWLSVIANLLVGVSLGLPLFLLLRQIEMDKDSARR